LKNFENKLEELRKQAFVVKFSSDKEKPENDCK
jgi:hypothetical protein